MSAKGRPEREYRSAQREGTPVSPPGRPKGLSAQMSRSAQREDTSMNAPEPKDLPLSGIRVIDFTQVMLGPVCTQMLGDYGADVIKIERKGAGDLSRTTFEPVAGHDNPVFCSLNRNKRSVAVDLKNRSEERRVGK